MIHRTALVTGAGSGMGQAIAIGMAEMGLRVALVGRDQAKLEHIRDKLGPDASAVRVEPGDVTDCPAVAAVVRRVLDEFGSIDVLVCGAGVDVPNRSFDVLEPADWDKMIATNLTGAFNLVYAVLPAMRERRHGLVSQICSISGLRASALGGAGYSASKFGQAALGLCLGREKRLRGIKSSVIYPGEVNTPILDARPVPVPAERRAATLQPEDVFAAVRFLVELPARASVSELVITPTIDEFF